MEQTSIQTNPTPKHESKRHKIYLFIQNMDTKTKLATYVALTVLFIGGFVMLLKLLPSEAPQSISAEQYRQLSELMEQEKRVNLSLIEQKNKLSSAMETYVNLRKSRQDLKDKQDTTINAGLSEDQLKAVEKVTDADTVAFLKGE